MAIDRVLPLKLENPADGGTELDIFPTEVNPTNDYIGAKGFVIENNENIRIDADASGNMIFRDVVTGTTYTLAQLAVPVSDPNIEAFAMIQGVL